MSSGIRIAGRQIGAGALLAGLTAALVIVALIAPEPQQGAGNASSYSTAPDGARMAFELAERMGWSATRREAQLDTGDGRSVQVVLAPEQPLGEIEVHHLLQNVRRGGGLIFDITRGGEIADSIGARGAGATMLLYRYGDRECAPRQSVELAATAVLPPTIQALKWRRPPPGPVAAISLPGVRGDLQKVGVTFSMGAGRVVIMGSPALFENHAVRTCEWNADVAVARALELVQPPGDTRPPLVFDEYHHGYGSHGGSVQAVAGYLAHTSSGHFLEQALAAALVLLFASAPRAIAPRDLATTHRRSPLEHADALARAYSDVAATRTATSRLVSGVRRRVGRTVTVHAAADDNAFLDAVVLRTPALAPSVETVRNALSNTLTSRQLAAVATAIIDIEHQLTTTPPTLS